MKLIHQNVEHRWVPAANYHCTLNFLGEVNKAQVFDLEDSLNTVAFRHGPFKLKIQGVNAFPTPKEARVIYVGFQDSQKLQALQEDLVSVLRDRFHFQERLFHPHLSIAHLSKTRDLNHILGPLKHLDFGELSVAQIILFESIGDGKFPRYVPLRKFSLTYSSSHI
jgi:2'-5' RNA ligase